jgi:hypothetical protein
MDEKNEEIEKTFKKFQPGEHVKVKLTDELVSVKYHNVQTGKVYVIPPNSEGYWVDGKQLLRQESPVEKIARARISLRK